MGARTFAGLYTERFHQARNEVMRLEAMPQEDRIAWNESERALYSHWANELITMRGVLRDLQRMPAGKVSVSKKLLYPRLQPPTVPAAGGDHEGE
jgi:hypothetical protein